MPRAIRIENVNHRFGGEKYYWLIRDVESDGVDRSFGIPESPVKRDILLTGNELYWATLRPDRSPDDIPKEPIQEPPAPKESWKVRFLMWLLGKFKKAAVA